MSNIVRLPGPKSERGGFFAVDRRTWPRVVALGMNPSVAYLVLARGTGGDNRTTSWSTNAIEKYTGIGRPRAIKAIDALLSAGLVSRLRGGSRPQYYILPDANPDADWIWLPNELIDGAAGELPPIERIRQSHSQGALRLLIDMYGAHDLWGEGGIPWRTPVGVRQDFTRNRLGEWGRYVIWGFKRDQDRDEDCVTYRTSPLVQPHLLESGSSQERIDPFWKAVAVLVKGGLLQFIPHLVDANTPDGEIIHSLASPDQDATAAEAEIVMAAQKAAIDMLPASRHGMIARTGSTIVIPVDALMSEAQVVGVGRLRYRPKTRATAAWLASSVDWTEWAERYRDISEHMRVSPDVQHQR